MAGKELEVARSIYRTHLASFARRAFSIINPGVKLDWGWHLDCMAEHLEAVYRGEITNLIVNVPPRTLKSFMCSICFPAWVLGRQPHEQFLVASHSLSPVASSLSRDTRLLMQSEWYQWLFDTRLAADQNEKINFKTTENGHRVAVSVGKNFTGVGANYLILDDPNAPDEALSDAIRTRTNEWVGSTFLNRMNNAATGRLITVMQRLHINDVTGLLLDMGGAVHLKMPLYNSGADKTYSIGKKTYIYKADEPLLAERYTPDVIEKIRQRAGSEYVFAGQQMQEPVPLGGGEFKVEWFQYYDGDLPVNQMNVYILCDAANEKRASSDWTAFAVVGLHTDQNYYLLDLIKDKLNPTQRVDALMDLHRKWNARAGKPPIVGYEKYGVMTDTHYIKKRQAADGYRFPLIELGGKQPKKDRIRRLIPDMQNRRWYFPRALSRVLYNDLTVDLVQDMISSEFLVFPGGANHDDCIDAISRIHDADLGAVFPRERKVKVFSMNDTKYQTTNDSWLSF